MEIVQVTAEATYALRNEVLRPGLAVESCHFSGDFEKTTLHLSLQLQGEIVAIASFYRAPHKDFLRQNAFQLRGMATALTHRNQGFGALLLKAAIPMLKAQKCEFLWCNARERAESFYSRLGFSVHGQLFEIEGVGSHFVMFKDI